jgi:hypothetical protein
VERFARLARCDEMARLAALAALAALACSNPPAAAAPRPATPTAATPAPPRAAPRSIIRAAQPAARCGKLDARLDADATLLGGRLALRIPKAGGSLARAHGIMDAPQPVELEERLMIGGGPSAGRDPGDDALVVLGRETWQLDPDRATAEPGAPIQPGHLDDEAAKFLRAVYAPDLEVTAVAVADPAIRAYAGRPPHPHAEADADAALVLVVLLALPDATLQTVAFYTNPWLAADAGCADLADRVAASLAVGRRALGRAAGSRPLGPVAGGTLTVTVPADHVVVHQPGPDFDRYLVFRLRPLGLFPGKLVIAVDPYPDRDAGADGGASERGRLLGQAVTWRGERKPTGGALVATVPLGRGFVQVTLVATREAKFLDAFRAIAETLTIVK